MERQRHSPGLIRDAIIDFLASREADATVAEVRKAVENALGTVPASSIRSYLRLRPDIFFRTHRGRYKMQLGQPIEELFPPEDEEASEPQEFSYGKAHMVKGDCFKWLEDQSSNSIEAVVTDPPYGLVEYSPKQQAKLMAGIGGVWRIPPSFDGYKRSPLPRFTTLQASDLEHMRRFFKQLGVRLLRVLVPGAHLFLATNPLLSYIVVRSLVDSGFENRGVITRLVMTMRGGDRPKNAHEEFSHVTVMPRSMAEPWLLLRKPLEGRVQDNLRKWGTGGLRRLSPSKPFGDVIESHPTRSTERKLAPHPSLKPQAFLRQIVRASLPLEKGVVLDPFAGSGSTLAAANVLGYQSVGIELSPRYFEIAKLSVPALEKLKCPNISS